jgi:hypothetical protein
MITLAVTELVLVGAGAYTILNRLKKTTTRERILNAHGKIKEIHTGVKSENELAPKTYHLMVTLERAIEAYFEHLMKKPTKEEIENYVEVGRFSVFVTAMSLLVKIITTSSTLASLTTVILFVAVHMLIKKYEVK